VQVKSIINNDREGMMRHLLGMGLLFAGVAGWGGQAARAFEAPLVQGAPVNEVAGDLMAGIDMVGPMQGEPVASLPLLDVRYDEDAPINWRELMQPAPGTVDGVVTPAAILPVMGGSFWLNQGPSPTRFGQVENCVPDNEVVGAIHVALPHPTNPDIVYAGTVNGGVWKTTNATALRPTWVPLTDDQPSLSTGALEFDPLDPTFQTLIAGAGRFSSFGRAGGLRSGILRSFDGGDTWVALDGGGDLVDVNISGVASRGSTILVASDFAVPFVYSKIGLWRSTNDGVSFTQISVGNGSANGLPGGTIFDLAADPLDAGTFYLPIVFADQVGGQDGIYKSTDSGATWIKVSSLAMDSLLEGGQTSNVEISVSASGVVYVAILNFGQLQNGGVFRSDNGGSTWVLMDIPLTNETGGDVGTNPRYKPDAGIPGGQGAIHFSIVSDPIDPFRIYVGGDRQPAGFNDQFGFPNAIGANDFSGRLFRGDASAVSGSQWVHLTHSNSLGAPGGGTISSSAPHADSREMAFDANGNIIESDDGGIYRRTNPGSNAGDWYSIIGNLACTELHDVAYDSVSNIVIGGAQDTGTPQQSAVGSPVWDSVSTADGGDVKVDDTSLPGQSVRYSSFQNFFNFRRQTFDAANNLISSEFCDLSVGGNFLLNFDGNIRFVQPFVLNAVDATRGLVMTANLYESFDRFDHADGYQRIYCKLYHRCSLRRFPGWSAERGRDLLRIWRLDLAYYSCPHDWWWRVFVAACISGRHAA
jgi:hypothetical protein